MVRLQVPQWASKLSASCFEALFLFLCLFCCFFFCYLTNCALQIGFPKALWTSGASAQNIGDINYVCITEVDNYTYTHYSYKLNLIWQPKSASVHLCTTCQRPLTLHDSKSQFWNPNANPGLPIPAVQGHCRPLSHREAKALKAAGSLLSSAGKSRSPGLIQSHLKLLGKQSSEVENFSSQKLLENVLLLKGSFFGLIHGREEVVQCWMWPCRLSDVTSPRLGRVPWFW